MDQIIDQPGLTEVAKGLMFGLTKVRSAHEIENTSWLAVPGSFIDKSDHRFIGSCGVGPVPERGRSASQFGP